jgi:hypothetical protein
MRPVERFTQAGDLHVVFRIEIVAWPTRLALKPNNRRTASAVRKGYRLRLSRRHNFLRVAAEHTLKAAPAANAAAALSPRTATLPPPI